MYEKTVHFLQNMWIEPIEFQPNVASIIKSKPQNRKFVFIFYE